MSSWSDAIPILALVLGMWLLSLWRRDASLMDIAWGPGFLVVAVWQAILHGLHVRGAVVLALTGIWGLRLAWHIAGRHGGVEDPRYRRWREQAGPSWWWRSLFKVFLLQGGVLWLVARPVAEAVGRPLGEGSWLLAAGVVVAVGGLLLEMTADAQLRVFRSRPESRGTLCTRGLWRYSRHPNYFGDAVFWCGIFLLAAAAGAWWTVVSPVLMTLLLRFGSGVPLLEASLSRRPGWAAYAAATNAFFPWRPRS